MLSAGLARMMRRDLSTNKIGEIPGPLSAFFEDRRFCESTWRRLAGLPDRAGGAVPCLEDEGAVGTLAHLIGEPLVQMATACGVDLIERF